MAVGMSAGLRGSDVCCMGLAWQGRGGGGVGDARSGGGTALTEEHEEVRKECIGCTSGSCGTMYQELPSGVELHGGAGYGLAQPIAGRPAYGHRSGALFLGAAAWPRCIAGFGRDVARHCDVTSVSVEAGIASMNRRRTTSC
jgi:hypothetical protein